MKDSLKYIILSVVIFMWGSMSLAQSLGGALVDETSLYAMTKQMGQFISRFNYEEDQFGKRINPKDGSYRDNNLRRNTIPLLFDFGGSPASDDLKAFFVEDVTKDDSCYMTFLGGRWYAEVSTTFDYKGRDVNVLLILAIEKEGLGSKWVLTNVYFPEYNKMFPTGEWAEKEKHFLHPMSHELDFMNIYKAFENPYVVDFYASKDYTPDYLTLFFYEVKKGLMTFRQVNSLKFHILQIPDWYFEVSYIDRKGNNSGWLISNLIYVSEKEKQELLKFYQP